MRRFWTESEEEVLDRTYCDRSKAAILAALPGRTWTSIQVKAQRMNLERDKSAALPYSSRNIISEKVLDAHRSGKIQSPLAEMGVGQPPRPLENLAAVFLEPLGFEREVCVSRGKRGAPYRLDFAHKELKISIEIDGEQHRETRFRLRDETRDAYLQSLGWTVVRISNKEILNRIREFD